MNINESVYVERDGQQVAIEYGSKDPDSHERNDHVNYHFSTPSKLKRGVPQEPSLGGEQFQPRRCSLDAVADCFLKLN